MKKLMKGLAMGGLALALLGCSNKSASQPAEDTINVGILQYMEHESLNLTKEGFLEELEANGYKENENMKVNFYNSQGEQSNLQSMTQQLKGKNDVILTIGTPAAQAMANTDKKTPQLFSTVTDPVGASLVDSWDKPGHNVSGTSDRTPIDALMTLLLSVKPESKKVGILYNSSEANSVMQYNQAKAEVEKRGLELVAVSVASTNDVQQAIRTLADKSDVIFLPTDNTVASTMATIGEVVKDKKVPTVVGAEGMIEGALAAYGVNYKDLGKQTAQMALRILKEGADPADMSVEDGERYVLRVNEEMAKALGIDPKDIKEPTN